MGYLNNNSKNHESNLRKKVALYVSEVDSAVSSRTGVKRRNKALVERQISMGFDLPDRIDQGLNVSTPGNSLKEFLDLISQTVPEGDIYIFGGMLRDLTLFGVTGFTSDIDIVVDGDWDLAYPKLMKLGAIKNKFGGLRLCHGKVPIDIWLAKETWAVRNGYVSYGGVASLVETTVINWDAILMNWRTKSFIYRDNYFEDIDNRYIDIVLEYNPNPLGMFVRILRYILLKDARSISFSVAKYLYKSANRYSYEDVREAEFSSYGASCIHKKIYETFKERTLRVNEVGNEKSISVEAVRNPTNCLIV